MLDWYSKHGHLQTLGCHLHLPKHGLKGKRWQTLPLHARGKLCKRPGFGRKVVFSSFFTVAPALFMQKQITHDDIVPLVLNHGNNEVSTSLHCELHWSKEAAASSKATCPPTQMPPHSLSLSIGQTASIASNDCHRNTTETHKKLGSCQSLLSTS